MKIEIKSLHFELSKDDYDYAAEKISHLDKYFKNIISSGVNIICDHEDHKGNTYKIDAIIKIPGNDIFAKLESRDIKSGIDEIIEKLKQQILKNKGKQKPKRLDQAKQWMRGFFSKES